MLARVFFGMGLLAVGYLVGREIGRNESLRDDLARDKAREDGIPSEAGGPTQAGHDASARAGRRE
ncbi:MAG: hypothetical protein LJE61_02715 [Thiocapsa sp.]|nr:hypothetical protein [Thiocapsa sp.]MCG6896825.1 hypothetical protein [Thiocapsa sp.]MCG6984101.1 hypothetical protein [Thiocapsa sp.]